MNEKVYIASPYTYGNKKKNVKRQMDVADLLMTYGYTPFVPLLYHFQHTVHPRPDKEWLYLDLEWLKVCDLMVRIRPLDSSGNQIVSIGADLEEATAIKNNIPVVSFENIQELKRYLEKIQAWANGNLY